MGRPLAPLTITDEERAELRGWARRPKTAQGLALRARIVLLCAEDWSNQDVAEELGVSRLRVGKWRGRLVEMGLDGLVDTPRPGTPRQITDEDVERPAGLMIPGRVNRPRRESIPSDAYRYADDHLVGGRDSVSKWAIPAPRSASGGRPRGVLRHKRPGHMVLHRRPVLLPLR